MKATYGKYKFDTTTAEFQGVWENDKPKDDGLYLREELYKKHKRKSPNSHSRVATRYFLKCTGGKDTKYAKINKLGVFDKGEVILPLTEEEAKAWVIAHISEREVTRIFNSEDRVTTYISMTLDHKKQLKAIAKRRKISVAKLIEESLEEAGVLH